MKACYHQKCEEPGEYRFTWPGKDEDVVCRLHALELQKLASVIGMHLQLTPVVRHTAVWNPKGKVWTIIDQEKGMIVDHVGVEDPEVKEVFDSIFEIQAEFSESHIGVAMSLVDALAEKVLKIRSKL